MLNLSRKHTCHIKGAHTSQCILATEDGSEVIRKEVTFELTLKDSELKHLPVSPDAFALLVKESKGITEGQNSSSHTFKRDIGLCHYTITLDSEICQFTAEVKNKGKFTVKIVQGKAFVLWTVEALIKPEIATQIDRFTDREGLKMKSKIAQGDIPGLEEAAAQ